jgi:uncharacterized protein YndB with AHSA1/START domain
MTDAGSSFVYVTYIRTTAEELWAALIDPDFTRQYWFGMHPESEWRDAGEIVEIDPPRRLMLDWRNEFRPGLKAEGHSRCTIELEPMNGAVKLTIAHTMDMAGSKFIEAVSGGWPRILSNLKSLLETGSVALGR